MIDDEHGMASETRHVTHAGGLLNGIRLHHIEKRRKTGSQGRTTSTRFSHRDQPLSKIETSRQWHFLLAFLNLRNVFAWVGFSVGYVMQERISVMWPVSSTVRKTIRY